MLQSKGVSDRRILPAFFLCFFFGIFGAHRFYAGRVASGVLMLLTAGGFGIWWAIDLILIACGVFRDGDGRKISRWR